MYGYRQRVEFNQAWGFSRKNNEGGESEVVDGMEENDYNYGLGSLSW